jgi:hypothetical protein
VVGEINDELGTTHVTEDWLKQAGPKTQSPNAADKALQETITDDSTRNDTGTAGAGSAE